MKMTKVKLLDGNVVYLATMENIIDILREHPSFVRCLADLVHNDRPVSSIKDKSLVNNLIRYDLLDGSETLFLNMTVRSILLTITTPDGELRHPTLPPVE